MTITLSPTCTSLTGSLGQGFGYHIQRRGMTFCGVRQSRGYVPRDGHLRFIFACAELAKCGLHITGIQLTHAEMMNALHESGRGDYLWTFSYPNPLHADDVLRLKQKLVL